LLDEVWHAYPVDVLDGFIERTWRGNILYDGKGELVAILGMCLADFVCTLLRSDGAPHFVAVLEEFIENVSCNEAGGSGD